MNALAALFAAYKAADDKACDATDGAGRTPGPNKAAVTRAFRKLIKEIRRQNPAASHIEETAIIQQLQEAYAK